MISKIFKYALQKKILAAGFLLIAVGGYFAYQNLFENKNEAQYLTAAVEKGMMIGSVSGTGQVLALSQVDIKPKVSGEIVWLGILADQKVSSGQALLSIDDTDIKQQIADAEYDLDEAKRNYDTIVVDAEKTVNDAYGSGYDTISSAFFKLPNYIDDLQEVLGKEKGSLETNIWAYKTLLGETSLFIKKVLEDYYPAYDSFNDNFAFFRTVYRDQRDKIYQLISDTLETANLISAALQDARHMFDTITVSDYKRNTVASVIDKMKPQIESDISAISSTINSLQKIKDTIDNTNEDTPNKIISEQKSLEKKERALEDLKTDLCNHTVRAPFAGIIAKINVGKNDTVGSNTALATIITEQKMAEITLNEIDVAKIKVGQKATITFDAAEGLSISGKVREIDAIGNVSQGVVTYKVIVSFDEQDARIKPGMTASVSVIIDARPDVLMVPNSAIKYKGGSAYVEISGNNGAIQEQPVEVGLSNDTMTEITSGLSEGDKVITQTISSTNTSGSASASQPSNSMGGAGNNAMREVQMMIR